MELMIQNQRLNSGETAAAAVMEILSVPSLLILQDNGLSPEEIENKNRMSFTGLLSEFYQAYRVFSGQMPGAELSAEILWVSVPAENQVFRARIRLFIVLRALAADPSAAEGILKSMSSSLENLLRIRKYGYGTAAPEELQALLTNVPMQTASAVVKEEQVEQLANTMLNSCYVLSPLAAYANDMSALVNAMNDHPNCALSFQLLPASMTMEQQQVIAQTLLALDALSEGVQADGIGSLSVGAARRLAESYHYYQDARNSPLFYYNILVYGTRQDITEIQSKVFGFFSADPAKLTLLRYVTLSEQQVPFRSAFAPLPWAASEILVQTDRRQDMYAPQNPFAPLFNLPYIITAEEASGFFRLPVGSPQASAGLPVNETDMTGKEFGRDLINTGDITIGTLRATGGRDTIGIRLKDLAKHMLIVGTPGSGKTTFSVSLLDRLWKEHGIPFLVIEPAKNEYRALVQSIPDLQIFTPGKSFISPFVFNPFVPPENVRLETYKSVLKTAFAAGVSMTTPLDKIFEEAISNCYSDFRWLDTYTSADKGRVFNISDFVRCFQDTFDRIGYTGDAKNIGRAGTVRLKSLETLFDNYATVPIGDLLSKPTVIELAAIENAEQKALIIALLLLSILSYVNANFKGEGGLRNVILLEEAHVLLDSGSRVGQGESDPAGIAQGLVKRMLAEIRSYGVGIVIADQSPRKVTTDVVGLTDMKLVFRQVEATDKQIIADSINLTEAQVQRLSKLKPGEAFLFFNRLDEAEEVTTPDYRLENKISITLTDEEIAKLSTYWDTRQAMLRPYPECCRICWCQEKCDMGRRILARDIARRIFERNFKPEETGLEPVKKVFAHISALIKAELNDEPFTPELLACVKVHLWRKIRTGTRIRIKDSVIAHSLDLCGKEQ